MPASPASVTSSTFDAAPRLLVVVPTWLGDGVMVMPAMAGLRKRLPRAHIAVLAKPSVLPVWSLFSGVDAAIPLKKGLSGMLETVRLVKAEKFDFAYILPNSFRSAWVPWLAGIPGCRGVSSQWRQWMLTESVKISDSTRCGHQSLEMAEILGLSPDKLEVPPFLVVPEVEWEKARCKLSGKLPCIAFFPGATYGPAKRWPVDRFVALGRQLMSQGFGILLLGGKTDKPLCDEVAAGVGEGALNMAGETALTELAGLLVSCQAVVANDSGGMHLAAGLGVKVVGIFGLTDPVKTSPVGVQNRILCAEGVARSRDIARDSAEARAAMESISVETVYQAVLDLAGVMGDGSSSNQL